MKTKKSKEKPHEDISGATRIPHFACWFWSAVKISNKVIWQGRTRKEIGMNKQTWKSSTKKLFTQISLWWAQFQKMHVHKKKWQELRTELWIMNMRKSEKKIRKRPKKSVDYQGSLVSSLESYISGNLTTKSNKEAWEYA